MRTPYIKHMITLYITTEENPTVKGSKPYHFGFSTHLWNKELHGVVVFFEPNLWEFLLTAYSYRFCGLCKQYNKTKQKKAKKNTAVSRGTRSTHCRLVCVLSKGLSRVSELAIFFLLCLVNHPIQLLFEFLPARIEDWLKPCEDEVIPGVPNGPGDQNNNL